ncbi:ABC1 family-domain-containing protein [Rhodocollybia butyracea]|uniref:ABC1 family-domain-containing protein n=1 Tax=Rhodocollybia butyracea TaxID=206335 RepID=A0A9P5UA78_9AGAR|nr:ABC1 family-domain-containing protein [Rhodocollybia butyracea]
MMLHLRICLLNARPYACKRSLSRPFWPSERRLYAKQTSPNHRQKYSNRNQVNRKPWIYPVSLLLLAGAGTFAYHNSKSFRYAVLAGLRCSRVAEACILGVIDYKITFFKTYGSQEEQFAAYSDCHKRSASRVLRSLLANGGIFIKLGQHLGSLIVLPKEWTTTMRPLQDQCEPSTYEAVDAMFRSDMRQSIDELFVEFDRKPVGVASLAQVHVARLRETGEKVAVKLQHPHLAEFADVDMEMVEVSLGWIKYWFPEFELTWLGEEMRINLPKEMDFVHEASNATITAREFEHVKTSLYIPKVITANKRVLIMEYIQGGRVDDLEYLAEKNIDRNKVAIELSRIFNRMVFINGWFHADPHPGNLLIRPADLRSESPYNFEVVLLDHGQYFNLDDELRVNYSKFWLSLMAPGSPSVNADRRKYAKLVGNIGPDLYPVFEAAMTGRAAMEGTWEERPSDSAPSFKRASGMMTVSPQSEEEMEAIRTAVVNQEGLLVSVFDVLRRVPRRVLMVLKLNDLTRSLDHSLATTHSNIRIFLVTAKFCLQSVWRSDQERLIDAMRSRGLLSFGLLLEYFKCWWRYERGYTALVFTETWLDSEANVYKLRDWLYGLRRQGFKGAHKAAAGLNIL